MDWGGMERGGMGTRGGEVNGEERDCRGELHGDLLGGVHGGWRAAFLGKGEVERLWEREGSGVGVRERLLGRQIERGRARQERGAG